MVRAKGEGSIYKRSDGRWVGQVVVGRYTNGRPKYARVVRGSQAEVVEAMPELRQQGDTGTTIDRTSTVATYTAWWLDNVLPASGVTPATITKYRWVLDHWVLPHVGRRRLGRLTPAHVQTMLRELEKTGLAPRSRSQARTVFGRALAWADQAGIVARNVAAAVDGPRLGSAGKIDDALTADEAWAVLAQARGDRLEALAVVALRLGLRRGEALALRWPDVDLEAGELTVTNGKTAAATRTIPLVAGTAAALKSHRKRQAAERLEAGPLWHDTRHVFTREDGRPLIPRSALRWWHDLTEAAGIGRRRFHASRHTCAVLLLDQGVPLEVVSAVLGHANLSITADVYATVTADSKRRALAKLEGPTQ